MERTITFTAILVAIAFTGASATIINVPDDYETIQEGIDASTDGDTVLVQPETYVENINFNGHNTVLGSLFLTTGDTTYIAQTIIDGDSSGSVVTFENDEDSTALITGFTIQNGVYMFYGLTWGGGVQCDSSSPTIKNNIIRENLAVFGGGISCNYSSAHIISNIIYDNKADRSRPESYNGYGGGIYCKYSNPLIRNNIIKGNWVFVRGAGIYCGYRSNPSIDNNMIFNNIADINGGIGGGISLWDTSNAVITNNIISYNFAYSRGGGIYIRRSDPVIENNVISSDSTYSRGGGIYCRDANPYIHNNVIEANVARGYRGWGGGIYCDDSNPKIINNLIIRNISDGTDEGRGGGIYCEDSNPEIINNSIIGNFTDSYWSGGFGGGIYCKSSNPIITNCTISGNSADSFGGGIYCFESTPTITNNTITGNSAYVSGGGIYCELVSNPVITNTIFWADSASYSPEIDFDDSSSPYFTYCDIQGGWAGEGNIDLDPLFRDPENGDFHLMFTECGNPYDSPCIDAGDPAIFDSMLDCDWGLGEYRSDMGAYGGEGIPTNVGEEQSPEMPMQFLLSQNYPNPFNASTNIHYTLPTPSHVTIAIYDILGRRIETLVQAEQQAGYLQVVWDASDHSSGMYFYRIKAGEYAETRKMVLLK